MINETIKTIRQLKGLSKKETSRMTGISVETITRLEAKTSKDKRAMISLSSLSACYGMPLTKIYEIDEVKEKYCLSDDELKFVIIDTIVNSPEHAEESMLKLRRK